MVMPHRTGSLGSGDEKARGEQKFELSPRRLPLRYVVSDCVNRWFHATHKAAREGDPAMQSLLGQMLIYGYGSHQDIREGLDWLKKASGTEPEARSLYAALTGNVNADMIEAPIESLNLEDSVNSTRSEGGRDLLRQHGKHRQMPAKYRNCEIGYPSTEGLMPNGDVSFPKTL
eukprot:jgi/Mesen1/6333/ME000328S05617